MKLRLKEKEIHELQNMTRMHCVSMAYDFGGMSKERKKKQWKRHCEDAVNRMRNDLHLSEHDIKITLKPAFHLLKDEKLWNQNFTSILHYMSADHTSYTTLPYHISSFIHVDDRYITSPLIKGKKHDYQIDLIDSGSSLVLTENDVQMNVAGNPWLAFERSLQENDVDLLMVRSDVYKNYSDRIRLIDEFIVGTVEDGGQSVLLDAAEWPLDDSLVVASVVN